MNGSERRGVRGTIAVPADAPEETATVIVQVEDVSRADAPSLVVGEIRRSGTQLRPGQEIPFAIEIPAEDIDERHHYSVRTHIDIEGTGDVKVGDLVSTQSYPVLTHGYGDEVRVTVRRV